MANEIDARGLLCPEPVLLAKKELSKQNKGLIKVLVNTSAAKENITRMAENSGWKVIISSQGEDFLLEISK